MINLTPDKAAVFREAFRVPRPRGRVVVSDIALLRELPLVVRDSAAAYVSCLSGVVSKDAYLETIRTAGFENVRIVEESPFPLDCMANDPRHK